MYDFASGYEYLIYVQRFFFKLIAISVQGQSATKEPENQLYRSNGIVADCTNRRCEISILLALRVDENGSIVHSNTIRFALAMVVLVS